MPSFFVKISSVILSPITYTRNYSLINKCLAFEIDKYQIRITLLKNPSYRAKNAIKVTEFVRQNVHFQYLFLVLYIDFFKTKNTHIYDSFDFGLVANQAKILLSCRTENCTSHHRPL